MRTSSFLRSGVVTVGVVFSLYATAQEAAPKAAKETRPLTLYQKLERANATGGPAPRRDVTGFWTGPLTPKLGPAPEMTPAGQAQFKLNKPDIFSASTNDPWATCDPLGVPRTMTTETRGVAFATMPDRIVILTQYQKIWRAVWMDGRELPKNIGAKGGPQPIWYGYSVGHWDGDYTLVVNTAGVDDSTWLDRRGYPHSADMRVEERFTRVNHDVLEVTVTVDDPKYYTKPFALATSRFRWIPNQDDEEQLCVPSEAIEYRKMVVVPAGQDQALGKK